MEKKYYFRGLGLGIIVTAVIMGIALSDGGKKEKMTDAEVIARAKELGMIEDSRLLEPAVEEDGQEDKGEAKETPVQKDDAVKKDIAVAEKKAEAEKQAEAAKKEAAEKEAAQKDASAAGAPESLEEKENKGADAEKAGETEKPEEQEKPDAAGTGPSADTNEMTKQDEDIPEPETAAGPETDAAKSVTIASGDGSYTVARKLAEAGVVSSADAYDKFLCANGYDKKLRPGTFNIPADAGEEQIARIVTGQE